MEHQSVSIAVYGSEIVITRAVVYAVIQQITAGQATAMNRGGDTNGPSKSI